MKITEEKVQDLIDTLEAIAEEDVLVRESGGAFAFQALKFRQAQASAALDRFKRGT